MLDSMRNLMGGVIAKILIGLLVISFAVWGVSDAFIGGAGTNTVVVGDTKVGLDDYRLAYISRTNALQRQLNQRLSREQLQSLGVEQAVMAEVVAGAVLDETARKMGLGVSDDGLAAIIGDDPAFQDATGNFSRQYLEFALRQVGMREEDYLENRRGAAVREQLLAATSQNIDMPQAFLDAYQDYQTQRRVFRYLSIGPDMVPPPAQPTEAQLREFYEANLDDYRAPEFRRLVVVRLTAEDIAQPEEVTGDELEAEYERVKENFATAERRRVQQINFPDQAAAEKAAQELADGRSFEEVAEDMGRTIQDTDLGLLSKDDIPDQNIANAAFELETGETSEIVSGVFGPVILKVTEIQEGEIKSLESVEEELRNTIALEKATDQLFDMHDRLEDERAAGDSLSDAARKVGLDARTIEQVDSEGNAPDGTPIEGIPEPEQVLSEAFETDEGVEADPVSLGSNGFVWYEVAGVTDERQKDFGEVRDEVEEAWTRSETAKNVEAAAQEIRDRVAKGEGFSEAVASVLQQTGDTEPVEPQNSAMMTRNDTGQNLVRDAVTAAFSVPLNDVIVAPGSDATSRVVIEIAEVISGDEAPPPEDLKNQVNDALANDLTNLLIGDLQSREEVSVNSQAIETAITY